MSIRPSSTCCGCASLLVGVEVICLVTLISQITAIALASSDEPISLASVVVPPWVQVLLASWAFVGIPLVILAGVGALYRIENNLRMFFWYMLASLIVDVSIPLWYLLSGQLCGNFVSNEVQRLGSALVCTFSDSFLFFWTLILAVIHMYMIYIVWSAAEEIAHAPYPELLKYADKLQGFKPPEAPVGPYPVNTRAVPSPEQGAAQPRVRASAATQQSSPRPMVGSPRTLGSSSLMPPSLPAPPFQLSPTSSSPGALPSVPANPFASSRVGAGTTLGTIIPPTSGLAGRGGSGVAEQAFATNYGSVQSRSDLQSFNPHPGSGMTTFSSVPAMPNAGGTLTRAPVTIEQN